MNKSLESPIFSNEHYKILQLDQVGRDDKSLREFNAELLQKVGDYRKKNLELASVENTLKSELATQAIRFADRERELTQKFQRELDLLKKTIEDDRIANEQAVEEWNRKLAKLADESWSKGLEIEGLRQINEAFRQRESELITAFEALRVEYSNIDNCYKDANEATTRVRSELRAREDEHQVRLTEQEKVLRAAYLAENQAMIAENSKLREMLSVRDQRLEQDRAALQTWREQLGYLDQHLRQLSDSIKKDRTEVLRTAKSVAEEVQFNLHHPFTEYLEIAEKEVAHLEAQLAGTSEMSPLRSKLEARHLNAKSHRDSILEILEQAKGGLNEHAKSIQAVLKNLETLTI